MKLTRLYRATMFPFFSSIGYAVVPTYRIRPPGINRPRELVGLTDMLSTERTTFH